MRRRIPAMVIAVALSLVFLPTLVEGKAGSGSSMGSRGSRTYQSNGAQPIERSITPPPAAPSMPSTSPRPAAPQYQTEVPPRPGLYQRNPFWSGFFGGLVGAGIGAWLFGGPFFGSGIGGVLGAFLQIGLIFLLVRLAVGFFRQRAAGLAGRPAVAAPMGAETRPAKGPLVEFPLTQTDLSTFEQMLTHIQAAWSQGNLGALKSLTTPEIVGYLEEQLRNNWTRGVQNQVEQVRLMKGDVVETWREGGLDYATVAMRWSAVDYMVRAGTHQVVDGDPATPIETTELWTLLRRAGGPWQLTAIQQV